MTQEIVIHAYRASWPLAFEILQADLQEVLGELALRIAGNPNQQDALLFRHTLRAHPRSVETLELIMHEIVKRRAHDVETDYSIKDPVTDLIWDAAQEWTVYTGWEG